MVSGAASTNSSSAAQRGWESRVAASQRAREEGFIVDSKTEMKGGAMASAADPGQAEQEGIFTGGLLLRRAGAGLVAAVELGAQ
ncbi:hypothetical protein D3C78_1756100 [compost metagenome]